MWRDWQGLGITVPQERRRMPQSALLLSLSSNLHRLPGPPVLQSCGSWSWLIPWWSPCISHQSSVGATTHGWQVLPGWRECRDFGISLGSQCHLLVHGKMHPSPLWLGAVVFVCVGVPVGFNGVLCKEHGFRLLKTSWVSEGCNQSDQQASEAAAVGGCLGWTWYQHAVRHWLMLMTGSSCLV